LIFLAHAAVALTLAADFRASAVKVDITPKNTQWLMGYGARQSTGVLDTIHHRILAMDDGKGTQIFLIASDLCVFSPSVYDDFTRELEKETGIKPRQIWWTVTHTHSSPELGPPGVYDVLLKGRSDHPWDREYLALVTDALKRGILDARTKLAPARVWSGVGFSRANINRRSRDVDGTISLGLNPDGVVDTQLGLLRIEPLAGGTPIALVANYAMHGTVLGGRSMLISGDGPGIVADYVEKKTGSIVLFVNSAAGNLAPIYSTQESSRGRQLGEFRVLLGDRILQTNAKLEKPTAKFTLGLEEIIVETARREGLGWPPELGAYAGASTVKIPVRILRMGGTVMWGAPVELFCEIALRVRKESGYGQTFFFGYANGWLGYLPTSVAFQEGGYEPRTSPFTPAVEKDFGDAVVKAIRGGRKR
jgi:neutral ceramidase